MVAKRRLQLDNSLAELNIQYTQTQEGDSRNASRDPSPLPRKSTQPHLGRRGTLPHHADVPEVPVPPSPKSSARVQMSECVAAINQAPAQPEKRNVFALTNQRKNLSPWIQGTFQPLLRTPAPLGRNTLVLDIDETLVHASVEEKPSDLIIPVVYRGKSANVYVKLRPGVEEFLDIVSGLFEVVTFTASLPLYASPLMDQLDPKGKLGGKRLYRDHCSRYGDVLVKDLFRLGRPLERTIIIDNSPQAFSLQPRNGIPIKSFLGERNDNELMALIPLLRKLAETDDVYPLLDAYNSDL